MSIPSLSPKEPRNSVLYAINLIGLGAVAAHEIQDPLHRCLAFVAMGLVVYVIGYVTR